MYNLMICICACKDETHMLDALVFMRIPWSVDLEYPNVTSPHSSSRIFLQFFAQLS